MQFSAEFLAGFRSAISHVGSEGDQRGKDWSEPYKFLIATLAAYTVEPPRKHDQWEYIWMHILSPSDLNEWGAKGWELCYGYDSRTAHDQTSQYCFFKRRKI